MRMELHTPHSRVRNSGFGLPLGRKDPGQGQNSSSLNVLAQKCLFLTPKTLFSVPVRERRLSPSPVFLWISENFFSIF